MFIRRVTAREKTFGCLTNLTGLLGLEYQQDKKARLLLVSGRRLASCVGSNPTETGGQRKPKHNAVKNDEMNWNRKKYKIRFENGDEQSITGNSNGLFGLSEAGVLTHLKTGYRVARFPDQQSGQAAGNYLAAAYAAEFAALNRAFRKSMTHDQFRSLAEAADLNRKINDDRYFNQQIAAAGVERNGGSQ